MTPREALIFHLQSIFPILGGLDLGPIFFWKILALFLCLTTAWRNPVRYFWSTFFTMCLMPALLAFGITDIVSFFVHTYLIWMCAEISCQSLAVEASRRLVGWWLFPLFLVFCL